MRYLSIALLIVSSSALAAPVQIPVHGRLTNADGEAIDGQIQVTFRLYPTQGAAASFTQVQQVTFTAGAFAAYVGSNNLLDSSVFAASNNMLLGIQIADDVEMTPFAIGNAPYAAWAWHAADAESLEGLSADDFLRTDYRPDWSDIQGRPAGLDDGDDEGAGGADLVAGNGLNLIGDILSVDNDTIEDLARGVCFDTRTELRAELDDRYRAADWAPGWGDITGVPPGFSDNLDNDTTYSAGAGVSILNTVVSVDTAWLDARVDSRIASSDTGSMSEEELFALLDGRFLDTSYEPAWADLVGIPPEFADGLDANTTYAAGSGLTLAATTFALDSASVDTRARSVCFDNEGELLSTLNDNYRSSSWFPEAAGLRAILDPVYAPANYVPTESALRASLDDVYAPVGYVPSTSALQSALAGSFAAPDYVPSEAALRATLDDVYGAPAWTSLTGIPQGFSDNLDDDTLDGISCLAGESPVFNGATWDCEDLHVDALAGPDLAALLADEPLELGAGTTVDGAPLLTSSTAAAAVATAFPHLLTYPTSPMLMFGFNTEGCDLRGGSIYANWVRFPTRHTSATPAIVLTGDLSLTNSGAGSWRLQTLNRDRFGYTCDGYAEGMAWAAMESGTFTVGTKKVAAGTVASAKTNDTVFFPTTFPTAPVVILTPGPGNAWARVIGTSGVTTGGFQVAVATADKPLHWIAFEEGTYNHGPWRFEVGRITDPDNNETKSVSGFSTPPNVLLTPIDTNNSGATTYLRVHDSTTSNFKIGADANTGTEFAGYVAFEELR